MTLELIDYTDQVAQLMDPDNQDDRGASWLARVTDRIVSDSGLTAHVVSEKGRTAHSTPSRRSWDVEVEVGGRSVALIDVDVVSERDQASAVMDRFDSVRVKAMDCWRTVTRAPHPAPPRPWLAFVLAVDVAISDGIVQHDREFAPASQAFAAKLDRMIKERTLDAACVIVVDPSTGVASYPNDALSFRCLRGCLARPVRVLQRGGDQMMCIQRRARHVAEQYCPDRSDAVELRSGQVERRDA